MALSHAAPRPLHPPKHTLKILVIDDAADVRADLVTTLRQVGHSCDEAATVEAAFLALASATYAAVVLDLVLDRDPTQLRAALALRGVPVLLVSGADPERLPAVAREHGWSYLAKPWEPDALVAAVQRLLEGGRAADVTGSQSAIRRDPDGTVRASKGTAQIVSETVVDVLALGVLAGELLVVRPASEWIQGGCIAGLLLLAGVRVADLVALSRGLPQRGGPAAVVLATLAAAASRLGDNA